MTYCNLLYVCICVRVRACTRAYACIRVCAYAWARAWIGVRAFVRSRFALVHVRVRIHPFRCRPTPTTTSAPYRHSGQIVYLPLDGDLKDHSGIGHHGTVPAGYSRPAFTCLDKAVNCSALFRGSQCVSVDSLAMTSWGSHDDSSAFIPQASFAVWFKRISLGTGHSQIGGQWMCVVGSRSASSCFYHRSCELCCIYAFNNTGLFYYYWWRWYRCYLWCSTVLFSHVMINIFQENNTICLSSITMFV